MSPKKKLLFIPADVISNEVSRSFFFAKYLSEQYDLYFLSRFDPQNAYFEKKKRSKLFTLTCFFKSVFTSTQYDKHQKWGYTVVKIPFMSHMVIHRFIGMVRALKMSRSFNRRSLEKIVSKVKPDVIFHADGFDYYPALPHQFTVSDMQDDFDKGNFRDNQYNTEYVRSQLAASKLNFVVSKKAAANLGEVYAQPFVYQPNGVETDIMLDKNETAIAGIRKKYGLEGKFIVSYIGADAWYDKELIRKVSELAKKADPDIHFLIVGNLPPIEADNITMTGPVSKDDSYHYYWVSDAGILFKDSNGSNFLYNSIPLKIIQYGIVNKWFLSPPIAWLEQENFGNVTILKDFSAENIVEKILAAKKNGQPAFDQQWNNYSWNRIVNDIHHRIASIQQ
ncbi:hypothetical protein [Pseudoflavitalea rhizosphaerae]|uniref:hypothetical protein n=1 Tax=Pseudoflavitalea rhizosphaerae TaxID=1884793 RepID=UPI000F8E6E40|nr:hypothetical protein [Pseudoflavitalea rhizosphaerae]